MKGHTLGVTLVELLIATLIGLLIMAAALRLVSSSRDVTSVTVGQATASQELQATLGLIADDVRRASVIHDSLTSPSWVTGFPGITRALTLTLPATATCDVPQVSYAVMPRSNLTPSSVNTWLRLPEDADNTARQAIVRVERCYTLVGALTPTSRLVADYLDSVTFALARNGETTFSTTPTSATGGVPYQSVRIEAVSARTQQGRVIRVPSTGSLVTVASSRVVD